MNSQTQRISAEHRENLTEVPAALAYRHTGRNKKSQKVLDKSLKPCYIGYAGVA